MEFRALLADLKRYEYEIERLDRKYHLRHQYHQVEQDGVAWATISINRKKVAQMLADDVSRGAYQLAPGQARTLMIRRKQRRLYAFRTTDRIVHGAVASAITEVMDP